MATRSSSRYEPTPRTGHTPLLVDGNLYLWGGGMDGIPKVHDSPEKREFLSSVDVFQSDCGDWIRRETSGTPPLGVKGYCCAAVGDSLYYFGGYCGHVGCYHNSVHKLSTSSLQWTMLSPSTSESSSGAPMRKSSSGMVGFRDGEEDILCVVAGIAGLTPSHRQSGAQYKTDFGFAWCNEQHMFSLSTREWSSPRVTGQPPHPCSAFTLTPVGERRAALFGGMIGLASSDDLLIVELTKHTVHWTKINRPVNHSVEWPTGRQGHAATCVSGPLLVIVGGLTWYDDEWNTISDCWIHDLTTMKWKKLPLPDTVTERMFHSLSAIQLSPHVHNVLLVAFGGQRSLGGANLSYTVLIELIQGGDGQWVVGRVGAALEDKREYQQMFSEGRRRRRVEGSSDQLREQQLQLERAREVERRLMTELQQLTREKEQVTREKEQVTREKEQREQQLMRQVQQMTREKDQAVREKDQAVRELQAANTRGQEEVQQLRQQLSVMSIAEGREEQPHWVVRREEVELTEEVLGKGGWGEVRVAKFRGLRVAAKFLHDIILSHYNLRLFVREMTMAAKLRHPHLLLFIGATREGQAIILTELMPTSLRKELERRVMPRVHITSISQDVGRALCYLHQWQPHPIIHRDISSANVLLEPLPNGCWRAKVSDYGSANFTNLVSTTVGPGNPTYAAPEASSPRQHSPKMDVYSYGILLVEMCLGELPESQPERRQEQIQRIQWVSMVSLIRRCTSERPAHRPTMSNVMDLLASCST